LRSSARLRALALCALLPAGLARASSSQHAELARGAAEATARRTALREAWDHAKPGPVTALSGASSNPLEIQTDHGVFVLRRPRRGTDHGVRLNHAYELLATQLGHADMIPVAIKTATTHAIPEVGGGSPVMIMEHGGRDHVNASDAHKSWLSAVPEPTRIAGALLDLLSEHVDRHDGNVLVSRRGTVRLIDPDKAFGQSRGNGLRSVFFPGGPLGFDSRHQKSFQELPAAARAVVNALADASVHAVKHAYHLEHKEAAILVERAREVRDVGLAKAIEQYLGRSSLQ
jgi:hypothetical protein